MATILVLIVLAAVLFFLARSLVREKKSGGCSGSWRAGRRAQSNLAMYSPATEAATSTRAFRENTPAFASFPLAAL